MDQDRRIYATQQENFKQKKVCKTGKSRILIARQQFLMVFLWRQLHRDFCSSTIELARPDGAVTFTGLREASTGYITLFRLLRQYFLAFNNIQVVQKQVVAGLHIAAEAAAGRIPLEFANRQSDDAGARMYS